tara:strand:+ start:227 stop:661 length:435 start_codon:yes stop_codon:yes gene_type:complete
MVAITLTQKAGDAGVYANTFELEMYAGALGSETRWLDGAGGAGGATTSYPGSMDPFVATNTDTTNTAGGGLKLACFQVTTVMATGDIATIGGGASKIHAVICGSNGGVAGVGALISTETNTDDSITFTAGGTPVVPMNVWVICS